MKFNISFGNFFHPDITAPQILVMIAAIGDGIRFIKCALEELGHQVTLHESYMDKEAINLVYERFYYLDAERGPVSRLKRNGYRFGLICTEPMRTPGLYNPFELKNAKQIYEEFAYTASAADFVWHLLPEAGEACRALNPNSHFLRFGHVDGYTDVRPWSRRKLEADFVCSGIPTERRLALVTQLRQQGLSVIQTQSTPQYVRNSILEGVRGSLQVQKSDTHHIFSMARVYHAVMNEVPIIVEYDGAPTYLSPYCITAPQGKVVDACRDFVRRDPAVYAQEVLERFRREMPAAPAMAHLLRETGLV